jgi:hypothetical protein
MFFRVGMKGCLLVDVDHWKIKEGRKVYFPPFDGETPGTV